MEPINELAAALAKAKADMVNPAKNQTNFNKGKYADLATCLDAVTGPLADHGLSIVQTVRTDLNGQDRLQTTLIHSSGQSISDDGVALMGYDKGNVMQLYGSAMTYARRYGLVAICGVHQTDDDGNDFDQKRPTPKQPPKNLDEIFPTDKAGEADSNASGGEGAADTESSPVIVKIAWEDSHDFYEKYNAHLKEIFENEKIAARVRMTLLKEFEEMNREHIDQLPLAGQQKLKKMRLEYNKKLGAKK